MFWSVRVYILNMKEGLGVGNLEMADMVSKAVCEMDEFTYKIFKRVKGGPQLADRAYLKRVINKIEKGLNAGTEKFSREYFYDKGFTWTNDDLYLRCGARRIRYSWRIRKLFILHILLRLAKIYDGDNTPLIHALAKESSKLMHKLSWHIYLNGINVKDWARVCDMFEVVIVKNKFTNFEEPVKRMVRGLMCGVLSLASARAACACGLHAGNKAYHIFPPDPGMDVLNDIDLIALNKSKYMSFAENTMVSGELKQYRVGSRGWASTLKRGITVCKDCNVSEMVHFIQVKTSGRNYTNTKSGGQTLLTKSLGKSFVVNLTNGCRFNDEYRNILCKMNGLVPGAGMYLISIDPREYNLFLSFD